MTDILEIYKPPSMLFRLRHRFSQWLHRNAPSNLELHAARELKAAGYTPLGLPQKDDPNKWIQESVLELIRVFAKQGHSGFSAPYCIRVFEKLAMFEPLVPLSGADDEWNEVCEGTWQNNRCSHVFKDADGRAYDIQGKVFRDSDGGSYTSRDSRVYVVFPYTPSIEYVEVTPS